MTAPAVHYRRLLLHACKRNSVWSQLLSMALARQLRRHSMWTLPGTQPAQCLLL